MNQQDDLLDDLEDFVGSDWGLVQKDFQRAEYKKEVTHPVIPNIGYKAFYQLLVDLMDEPQLPPRMAELVYRIVVNRRKKITGAFEKIWDFFCAEPQHHEVYQEICKTCHASYSVIVKHTAPSISDEWRSEWRGEGMNQTIQMESERVFCMKCGSAFLHISHGKVVGAVDNKRRE